MDSKQLVKDVMKLVTEDKPQKTILIEAQNVKSEINKEISELTQASKLLDSIIATFAREADHLIPTNKPSTHKEDSTQPLMPLYIPTDAHILELADQFKVNGTVDTDKIIEKLKSEGDTRADRGIAISVGNKLTRNGWKQIYTGMYNEPSHEEVKK
jgi:hypothetical protein